MKNLFYVTLSAVALLLASCATNRTVSYTTSIGADNYDVNVKPLMATLQVEESHVTGEFQWVGKKRAVVNLEELRDNAIFNALQKKNADVLVTPQYQIETEIRASSKIVKVKVIGYPAKYVKFEPAPVPDALEIRELKNDANYVLVNTDSKGTVLGYKVVLPYEKNLKTLDLEDATVDKVILDGNKARIGRGKKAPKNTEPTEQKELLNISRKKK
jgi:hypothetical protein